MAASRNLRVDSVTASREILLAVLDGKDDGAAREVVIFNAGAALYAANVAASIEEGIERARAALASGAARAKLDEFVRFTQSVKN